MTIADERGIMSCCSPQFGERFFTTQEFQQKMVDMRLLTWLLWSRYKRLGPVDCYYPVPLNRSFLMSFDD